MDVQLYVYDLTRGMARTMSRSLLGIQIDAVYHTSLVFNGVEYFFGQGVQTCYPGSTHHGQPMEIIPLGRTQLPLEVILEYLESLKTIYTPESYDLFAHNCNNFTNDFAMFLVGKGIPEHITSLPETVLQTPFGQMLKPQIDASMRSITQAPVPPQKVPPAGRAGAVASSSSASNIAAASPGAAQTPAMRIAGNLDNFDSTSGAHGTVHNVTSISALDNLLDSAKDTCAVVFFTSSTCAPCKIAYPTYDSLAVEHPKVPFIKVDINAADSIALKYKIRATPTFMTFLHGHKEYEWTGADPSQLTGNVRLLISKAFVPHPHAQLRVPSLQRGSLSPVLFPKIPPLDKLTAKMGAAATSPAVTALKAFLTHRQQDGAREAPLPDLPTISTWLRQAPSVLDSSVLFTAYDLLRAALADPRTSGWFAEETPPLATPAALLSHVASLPEGTAPYALRLVALQLACNLFSSPLSAGAVLASQLPGIMVRLVTQSLLDTDHAPVRAAAASLAFNLAAANYRVRREEEREGVGEEVQVELAASLLETLGAEAEKGLGGEGGREPNPVLKPALYALGYLVYFARSEGEVWDLCAAMEARGTVVGSREGGVARGSGVEDLVRDVGELLGKGLE
ncbi:hypothetical protein M8818_000384 [Zalaria obscura]|uniref:Uncharacterized protein n=1 Tax=Zalaria obscura TaxID=2024903 RepID=A0ACC3SMR2_9PEZI